MESERAYSYARASQDRKGEELSVDRQHEDQRELAQRHGLTIVEEITDNDVSAAGRKRRPGFEAMLTGVRNGTATTIIATDMTRLTRGKADDELRLLELGVDIALKLRFVRAPDLDLSTAAGRLTASVLIASARAEIEIKSERQQRATVQAAQQGRRVGGRRPFGYEPDGVTIRTDEAAALRKAYDDILHGVSLGTIAADWNDDGLVTPQATRKGEPSPWKSQSLRSTLLNPRYAGLRHHVTRNMLKQMHPVHARIAGIVGPAQWPEIVPEETWRAVVTVLTDPQRSTQGQVKHRLLTGVAVCGAETGPGQTCGAPVHGGADRWHNPTYRCSVAYGHFGRRAQPVDEYVGLRVVERLSRPDARDLLVADDDSRPGAPKLRSELAALRKRRRALARLLTDGFLTEADVRAEAPRLDARIAEVEVELSDAGRVSLLGPLINAPDPEVAWEALDVDRQRAVVAELMDVVLLPPGRGTRTFRPETVLIRPKGKP